MALTADDIVRKEFRIAKFGGYDKIDVDDFLDEVADAVRELVAKNQELTEKLGSLDAEPTPTKEKAPEVVQEETKEVQEEGREALANLNASTPESATGLLYLAQKLHDEYISKGKEEAKKIVLEATSFSKKTTKETNDFVAKEKAKLEKERSSMERRIDDLRTFERDYRNKLRTYLEDLLSGIKVNFEDYAD